MRMLPLQLSLALLLALGAHAGAHAQSKPAAKDEPTVLPVWNKASGKLEAYLLLEPADGAQAGTRWRFGGNSLDAAFGLQAGDSLALLCDRKLGIASAIGNLANNCMLAALGDRLDGEASRRVSGSTALTTAAGKLGVSASTGRDSLPVWLAPGAGPGNRVDLNDLTVFARKDLPREAFVSIAGTVAKARLIPEAEAGLLADRWSTKSISVGGGFGAFGASIVGHVVDTPGQPKWEGLGLGLTWRTPWSGQLTVGADNVVTRGRNPFAPAGTETDEGTVPYVRYEQDL